MSAPVRRKAWPVHIGCVTIGSDYPVAVQSMTSTSTMDTPGSVAQIERIADAGGDIVRLTAQGVREAENLEEIRAQVRADGYETPLVADIHFNPRAAFSAASRVEKVRINPGNFVDPGRVFRKIEFTDEEYKAEIRKIEDGLVPLLDICKANGTALRIGVNHGSLSDRIMSRYGDTPAGMVESAMEFLRVCLRHDFCEVVISIKASNVTVMTETVRRLVAAMDAEDMHFPLHLGVTEAGDGEDGRIKSAVGIGSLLADGIGDTIRVSLSEEPECEIPVAMAILDHVAGMGDFTVPHASAFDPFAPVRRKSEWSDRLPVVVGLDLQPSDLSDDVVVLESFGSDASKMLEASLHSMLELEVDKPVILKIVYPEMSKDEIAIKASIDFGRLLLQGFADGIWIEADGHDREWLNQLSLNILQATRQRISKTEFIACPGCGRTLYDLQTTLRDIKAATSHLKGLKIGVMGCVVNGPGEMADADYGYVGAGVGKVSLYKGKECVLKNIDTADAIPALIELIKENGDWKEPE